MPSGHATTAAAAAIAIGALWPKARLAMWMYAAAIMASRVIIEAHYVSDVIAAAFVGAFGAVVVRNWFAARRLAFVPGPDGTVRALPGPSWRRVKAVARRLLPP
jgi:undecaprenyl-diphosphatase